MVAGVRRAREPQHRPRCLARSRRSRRSGGASVGRAIVRGRCGALKSTVGSFGEGVILTNNTGPKFTMKVFSLCVWAPEIRFIESIRLQRKAKQCRCAKV